MVRKRLVIYTVLDSFVFIYSIVIHQGIDEGCFLLDSVCFGNSEGLRYFIKVELEIVNLT